MAERTPAAQFRAALAIVGALLLASCGTLVPKGAVPRPAAPPPPVVALKPVVPGALPEDRERHRVALLVPLSGPNAGVGTSIANAATLALADTGGKALRITTYDTASGAAAAAARALADGNRLFLGPLLGDDVRAVAAPAAAAGVPVIAFSNDAAAASEGVWLLGYQPEQSIDRVVRYAKSRGMLRFAGLIPAGSYGRNAANSLLHAAEEAGGSVAVMQTYQRSPAAITAAVTALAKQKFDGVLIADSGRVAVQAVALLRKHGAAARLLGTELWAAEPGLNASPAMAGAWFASVDDARYVQLAERYRARYGRAPYRLASLGYDAVLLTVRIAADWRPDAPFPADRLADAGGFVGVDGAFRFGSGHVAERALAVHQIGTGGAKTVSSAPAAF